MPTQELDAHAVRLQDTIRTLEADCNALDQQIKDLSSQLKDLRHQRKLNRDFLRVFPVSENETDWVFRIRDTFGLLGRADPTWTNQF